jgi:hypothetical protein
VMCRSALPYRPMCLLGAPITSVSDLARLHNLHPIALTLRVELIKPVTAASTDSYLESRLSHVDYAADPSLARGIARAEAAGMPKIAVSAMQGQFLSVLARGIRAEKILEIGTLGG